MLPWHCSILSASTCQRSGAARGGGARATTTGAGEWRRLRLRHYDRRWLHRGHGRGLRDRSRHGDARRHRPRIQRFARDRRLRSRGFRHDGRKRCLGQWCLARLDRLGGFDVREPRRGGSRLVVRMDEPHDARRHDAGRTDRPAQARAVAPGTGCGNRERRVGRGGMQHGKLARHPGRRHALRYRGVARPLQRRAASRAQSTAGQRGLAADRTSRQAKTAAWHGQRRAPACDGPSASLL